MKYEKLITEATAARLLAYTPYSNFQVGAALECKDGRIFRGCNVENASYGSVQLRRAHRLLQCHRSRLQGLATSPRWPSSAQTDGPIAPCGACRQVILELGGNDLPVMLTNLAGDRFETTAAEQLPNAFAGRDLKK